jgi:hypothetical protein
MSKKKKKIIVSNTTSSETSTSSRSSSYFQSSNNLLFGKENYKWVFIGVALVILGMLLMIGGFNENPNEWDESGIYGFRRTVLAPAVIIAGLIVNVIALFKKSDLS